jgi:hypothetical protein
LLIRSYCSLPNTEIRNHNLHPFKSSTFYWSLSSKPGQRVVMYLFFGAIEFTFFYDFDIFELILQLGMCLFFIAVEKCRELRKVKSVESWEQLSTRCTFLNSLHVLSFSTLYIFYPSQLSTRFTFFNSLHFLPFSTLYTFSLSQLSTRFIFLNSLHFLPFSTLYTFYLSQLSTRFTFLNSLHFSPFSTLYTFYLSQLSTLFTFLNSLHFFPFSTLHFLPF